MASTDPRPLVAGRYELGVPLGSGGMGEVVAAHDRRLDREVALKWVRADLAHIPDAHRRIQAEARAAARITDPNVVAVFDSGIEQGRPFIVMERLDGETLADRIARGPLEVPEVRDLGLQVLAGLAAAHELGLVHRDVKPGNILAAPGGRWKVADFGIARWEDDDGGLTKTDHVLGSPSYLAPERLEGVAASPASDLYSLGVVLYEALTGRRPFIGDNPWSLALSIREGHFDAIRTLRPEADPALAAAIERAMDRDPDRRFTGAVAMASAIDGEAPTSPTATAVLPVWIDPDATVRLGSRPPAHDGAATPSSPAPVADAVGSPARRPWVGRLPLLVGLGLALGVLVLVLILTLGGGDAAPARPASATRGAAPSTVPASLRSALDDLEGTLQP